MRCASWYHGHSRLLGEVARRAHAWTAYVWPAGSDVTDPVDHGLQ